jgi:sulfite reductase (NADPH) flavoprotein alpha-component
MTASPIHTPVVVIPETAPFSAEQRAWLSGFFAATLVPPAQGATALSAPEAAGLGAAGPNMLANNDDAPWHDPAMPIADRMQLATSKPPAGTLCCPN